MSKKSNVGLSGIKDRILGHGQLEKVTPVATPFKPLEVTTSELAPTDEEVDAALNATNNEEVVDMKVTELSAIDQATIDNETEIAADSQDKLAEESTLVEIIADETKLTEEAHAMDEHTMNEAVKEFNAKEAAARIIERVEADQELEETGSLADLPSTEGAGMCTLAELQNTGEFATFMDRLKKAEEIIKAAEHQPLIPQSVRNNFIQLPANLEKETPEELTRLMKNVQSKKCRSKAMGRRAEYEDSLKAEARIKAAREAQGSTTATNRGAEVPEDLSEMPIEEIIRNLKNVQSKKCMAKAMGRTEVYDNMVVLETKLKAARDASSPKAGTYHLQAKGVIVAKIEECRKQLEEMDVEDTDNEEAVNHLATFIEALEWVMSATIPGQENTAK